VQPHNDTTVEDIGPLAEIGSILAAMNRRDQESEATATRLLEDRQAFFDQFQAICENAVRPGMEAVLGTLREAGGDGLIEEHPGGEPRVSTPRLTLWMSLNGAIIGTPRSDRHPYLQLDAEVDSGTIRLTEGDVWRGGGAGRSGTAGSWNPADVTRTVVIQELLDIVRRSSHVPTQ
jgi:hypothetical protein